jgi:uncharacterized membrane protein
MVAMTERRGAVGRRWSGLLDRGPLAVLVAFSVVAVVGYAVFGRDPSRVVELSPGAARFYAISFGFFAQAQIILAGVVLAVHLWRRSGARWVPAFLAVYAISLGSELMGTAFGVSFGPYSYTSLLGPMWLGLVPVLIPLSWFFMAVPAYGLAARLLSGSGAGGRILLGSLLLLAWDLSLDPAMSEVTRYWVWGERGPYYGMPLMNLVGWYVTGVALMAALEWLGGRSWLRGVSSGWQAAFYGANLILPLGMAAAAGLWGAVVATAAVLVAIVTWASLRVGSGSGAGTAPGGSGADTEGAARASSSSASVNGAARGASSGAGVVR